MIEVNGTAHVILTVSQWEKASTLHGTHLFFFFPVCGRFQSEYILNYSLTFT